MHPFDQEVLKDELILRLHKIRIHVGDSEEVAVLDSPITDSQTSSFDALNLEKFQSALPSPPRLALATDFALWLGKGHVLDRQPQYVAKFEFISSAIYSDCLTEPLQNDFLQNNLSGCYGK